MDEFSERITRRERISNWFSYNLGCFANEGLMYKVYNVFAGSVYCMCCLFWRGTFIGVILGGLLALLIGWFV